MMRSDARLEAAIEMGPGVQRSSDASGAHEPDVDTTSGPRRIEALHAGPTGAFFAGAATAVLMLAAGAVSGVLDFGYAITVAFLAVVVQQDTVARKIPNWLIAAGLVAAVGLHAWSGGAAAAGWSLVHALTPFAILFIPFALGLLGAGDVKAFMVLAALQGNEPAVMTIFYSAMVSGVVSFVWLWSQGALWLLLERMWGWWRTGFRKTQSDSDSGGASSRAGDALASALPLGGAIAAGFACHILIERFIA